MSRDGRDEKQTAVLEAGTSETGTEPAADQRVSGVVLGRLIGLESAEFALVEPSGTEVGTSVRARAVAGLTVADIGREVALMFEGGDPMRPMVIGLIEQAPAATTAHARKRPITIDADSITLEGQRDIILRCGKATLTLTRDGKLFVRGAYVETQATGVNRIKGGCVKIN